MSEEPEVRKKEPAKDAGAAKSVSMKVFDFHGDRIPCVRDGDKVWVVVKPVCEHLGLEPARQQKKLATYAWANCVPRYAVGADGKQRKMLMISIKSLDLWLAGISANRVRADLREKLIRYQTEAAEALYNYFRVGAAVNPRVAEDPNFKVKSVKAEAQIPTTPEQADKWHRVARMSQRYQSACSTFADICAKHGPGVAFGNDQLLAMLNVMVGLPEEEFIKGRPIARVVAVPPDRPPTVEDAKNLLNYIFGDGPTKKA